MYGKSAQRVLQDLIMHSRLWGEAGPETERVGSNLEDFGIGIGIRITRVPGLCGPLIELDLFRLCLVYGTVATSRAVRLTALNWIAR